MTLAERDRELSTLTDMLSSTAAGAGRVEIVLGAVGMGKTALLHEFAERNKGSGTLFLGAECFRAEQGHRFGVVRQLIEGCRSAGDSVRELVDRLDSGLSSGDAAGPHDEMTALAQHDLHALLTAVAAAQPVVLMIDDAHHADASSAQCLLHTIRRISSARVAAVLTTSNLPAHTDAPLATELLRQPNAHAIRLAALSERGVEDVLAERLGQAAAKRLVPAARAASGGSPLLVHAIIEDTVDTVDTAAESIAVGDAYGHAVASCLRRGPDLALRVAASVAALGDTGTVMLGQLVGESPALLARTVDALTDAGILDGGRLRRADAAAAVLGGLAPRERADLHRRATRLLYDHGVAPRTLARRLLAAGPVRGSWVADVLQEASRQAVADNDLELARQCLALGISASVDRTQAATSRMMLLNVEWRSDPSAAGAHLGPLTEASRRGWLAAEHTPALVRCLLWHGRTRAAASVLTGGAGSQATRRWLAHANPALANLVPANQDPDAHHAVAPPDLDLCTTADTALATVLTNRATAATVGEAKRVLRGLRPNERTIDAIESALLSLLYTDQLTDAGSFCDLLAGHVSGESAPTWQARLGSLRAEIHLRQGELRAAKRVARDALGRLTPAGWGVGIGAPLATLVTTAIAMGEHEEAARLLDQPVPDALPQSRQGLVYRHARGLCHLAMSRPEAALDEFSGCAKAMDDWGLDMPTLVPWRAGAAEAWIQLGEPERARQLLIEQLGMLGAGFPRARGVALRLLARTVAVDERRALLDDAIDLLRGCGDQLGLARALADSGMAYGMLGESRRARSHTRLARQLAGRCGAATPHPSEKDTTPPDLAPDRAAALTHTERRVAILAANGMTNREIAQQLFVTPSTVEQHLTRVFRKLEVKHRGGLSSWFGVRVLDPV
jgi:DNA-binding CsgD family transcriptional regulator